MMAQATAEPFFPLFGWDKATWKRLLQWARPAALDIEAAVLSAFKLKPNDDLQRLRELRYAWHAAGGADTGPQEDSTLWPPAPEPIDHSNI